MTPDRDERGDRSAVHERDAYSRETPAPSNQPITKVRTDTAVTDARSRRLRGFTQPVCPDRCSARHGDSGSGVAASEPDIDAAHRRDRGVVTPRASRVTTIGMARERLTRPPDISLEFD